MKAPNRIIAILVAGGRGTRAASDHPKQWHPLAGRRVADWTVRAFAQHPDIAGIVVVHHPDDLADAQSLPHSPALTEGGATRAASVQAGLVKAAGFDPSHVMIHDMARPCVEPDLLDRCIAALAHSDAAAPALPVTDALWRASRDKVLEPVDRSGLYRAQTPQCFEFTSITAAHRSAPETAKDDVEVALAAGLDVQIVVGSENNLKITYPADFSRAARLLEQL